MSNVSSFLFEKLTRLGDDNTSQDQNSIQNLNSSNYMLQNHFDRDCTMKKPMALSTSQPGILLNGGYNVGVGGCNIDQSSKLTMGTIQDNLKCQIDLFQRPYLTVPYLGRGSVDSVIESEIMQGERYTNKKSVNNTTEKSFIQYHNTPLLPHIKSQITDPAYLVEGVASKGWVRGGVASRDLTRDSEYLHK